MHLASSLVMDKILSVIYEGSVMPLGAITMTRKDDTPIFSQVPTYKELMQPLLDVLQTLGGSGTVSELNERIIAALNLTEEAASRIYEPDNSGQAKIKTNLSWAR